MKAASLASLYHWQQLVAELPWSAKSAAHSATIALSKACWMGIPQADAINHILMLSHSSYLSDNRQLLFAIWERTRRQMDGDANCSHEAEDPFESAA